MSPAVAKIIAGIVLILFVRLLLLAWSIGSALFGVTIMRRRCRVVW